MKPPPVFTAKIDPNLKDKLIEDLTQQGFSLNFPPYTFFQAKKKNITCTFYTSGSLVIQGKGKEEFIEFYIEPEILQSLAYTYPEVHLDKTPRIGVDEAGKGDLFGPLCIAAFFGDETSIPKLLEMHVKDSKRLSDKTIASLAIKLKSYPHVILRLYPETYNSLYEKFKNLNRLLAWAHATVITELSQKTGCGLARIDQFAHESLLERAIEQKKIKIQLEQMTKGERDIVIAAASILARDAFVQGLEKLSSEISFVLPKGAATHVKEAAKQILKDKGKTILGKVAKLHFKTIGEIENESFSLDL